MIVLIAALAAQAGPWTRSEGSFYAKAAADWYDTGSYVSPTAGEVADTQYFGHRYGVYGEIGLPTGHPVQLAASLPVVVGRVRFTRRDAFEDLNGTATSTRLGDLTLTPQVALHRELPIAAALEMKLPLYDNGGVCEGNPWQEYCPWAGDGQVDLTGWVSAGASLGGKGWTEAAVGYRHRTEWYPAGFLPLSYTDLVTSNATIGLLAGPLALAARADTAVAPAPDKRTSEYFRIGPSLLFDIVENVAIEGRYQHDLWTRNASAGFGFGAGVSVRR